MKEYQVINILEGIYEECVRDNDKDYIERNTALTEAVKALTEIQYYRAIGTVGECREARERQMGKKPVMKPFYEDMEEEYLCCPSCGDMLTDRIPMDNKDFYFHCLNCGQKLDWTDTP